MSKDASAEMSVSFGDGVSLKGPNREVTPTSFAEGIRARTGRRTRTAAEIIGSGLPGAAHAREVLERIDLGNKDLDFQNERARIAMAEADAAEQIDLPRIFNAALTMVRTRKGFDYVQLFPHSSIRGIYHIRSFEDSKNGKGRREVVESIIVPEDVSIPTDPQEAVTVVRRLGRAIQLELEDRTSQYNPSYEGHNIKTRKAEIYHETPEYDEGRSKWLYEGGTENAVLKSGKIYEDRDVLNEEPAQTSGDIENIFALINEPYNESQVTRYQSDVAPEISS